MRLKPLCAKRCPEDIASSIAPVPPFKMSLATGDAESTSACPTVALDSSGNIRMKTAFVDGEEASSESTVAAPHVYASPTSGVAGVLSKIIGESDDWDEEEEEEDYGNLFNPYEDGIQINIFVLQPLLMQRFAQIVALSGDWKGFALRSRGWFIRFKDICVA